MALTLGDNFSYQGAKPLDARLKYDTLAAMKAVADATMYDGCTAYCVEADKTYQWKSTNTVDESTGKWREFSSGGGSSYTAGDGIDITNDVISTDNMSASDMDEVITPLPSVINRHDVPLLFLKRLDLLSKEYPEQRTHIIIDSSDFEFEDDKFYMLHVVCAHDKNGNSLMGDNWVSFKTGTKAITWQSNNNLVVLYNNTTQKYEFGSRLDVSYDSTANEYKVTYDAETSYSILYDGLTATATSKTPTINTGYPANSYCVPRYIGIYTIND